MTNNLNNNPSLPLAGTKLMQTACNTGILEGYSCPFMKQASVEDFFSPSEWDALFSGQ